MCLREKLAAMREWRHISGNYIPEEVLTPLRDHNPCQGRDTLEGTWPTGDLRWNREMKRKSVWKT